MTREEVYKMSPTLKAASELKSPFAVPENYFREIEWKGTSLIPIIL